MRTEPNPVVRRSALEDFYIRYTLLVCLENPQQRSSTLDALHANILDAFNEYGVQITSPNYEADPEARKVVPADQWYAAPARAEAAGGPAVGGRVAVRSPLVRGPRSAVREPQERRRGPLSRCV